MVGYPVGLVERESQNRQQGGQRRLQGHRGDAESQDDSSDEGKNHKQRWIIQDHQCIEMMVKAHVTKIETNQDRGIKMLKINHFRRRGHLSLSRSLLGVPKLTMP